MADQESKQDFSEVLNNMKSITLGQVFRIIKKIKYSALITLFAMFTSMLGSAFIAGQYAQQQETAVSLQSPFAMRLIIDDKKYDFTNLTLLKDPMAPAVSADKVVLSLREIKNEFDVIPLGKIVATAEQKNLSYLWKIILSKSDISFISEAQAQKKRPVFDWNGHKGDYDFKEEYTKNHTVYRYYSDDCVLAYEVDKNRRSIPETFRWIERTH